MIRAFAAAVGALLLSACQSGSAGALMPEAGPGVELVRGEDDGDTAAIGAGGAVVRVAGTWASEGAQVLHVRYAGGRGSPATLDLQSFALARGDARLKLDSIDDLTAIDAGTPGAAGNAPLLYSAGSPGQFKPLPSVTGSRHLRVVFDGVQGAPGVQAGDAVTATVATPAGPVQVRFRAAD